MVATLWGGLSCPKVMEPFVLSLLMAFLFPWWVLQDFLVVMIKIKNTNVDQLMSSTFKQANDTAGYDHNNSWWKHTQLFMGPRVSPLEVDQRISMPERQHFAWRRCCWARPTVAVFFPCYIQSLNANVVLFFILSLFSSIPVFVLKIGVSLLLLRW